MEESGGRPSFRSVGGGERRLEIVSGKGYYSNQIYTTTTNPPRTPDSPQPRPAAAKPWGFSDPEMKRKKRIAKYKVYTVEGKVKASIRNGLRWIKIKCSQLIHGY